MIELLVERRSWWRGGEGRGGEGRRWWRGRALLLVMDDRAGFGFILMREFN